MKDWSENRSIFSFTLISIYSVGVYIIRVSTNKILHNEPQSMRYYIIEPLKYLQGQPHKYHYLQHISIYQPS